MNTEKAAAFNKNLENEDCRHPELRMEYAYGSPTGNFICSKCERLLPADFESVKALHGFWANTNHELTF